MHTQDILAADAVQDFFHGCEIGVLVENGGICTASLQSVQRLNTSLIAAFLQKDKEPGVPDNARLIFIAEADSEV